MFLCAIREVPSIRFFPIKNLFFWKCNLRKNYIFLSGIYNRRGGAVSTTCMVWIQTRPPTSISSPISASWKQIMIKAEIINCHSLSGWPLRNICVIHSETTGESPLGQVLATLLIYVWILQEYNHHHIGVVYPPFHPGLVVYCNPYQRATYAMEGQS